MIKKKIFKRIALAIALCMGTQTVAPALAYALENEGNIVRGYNPFIEYLIDKNDGRFIIRTLTGVPQRPNDDNQPLLFERNNDPETSFTTFRIDGEDYIFGNSYGSKSKRASDHHTSTDGRLSVSQWDFDGLEIKQALEIIEDPEHPNVGNVRIRYEVENKSGSSRTVGNRILLDTQLGSNDGSSFFVGNDTIATERELTGASIPDFYRTSDDEFAPNIMGYGFLKGWGNTAPDKLVFAHYETLSSKKWDVSLDGGLDFTSKKNKYGGADSAVAYYFNEKPLAAGETRTYETFFGLGDFSHYNSDSTYGLIVNAPDKLTVNDAKDGYAEEEVAVHVTIDNTLPDSENLTNVTVNLVKRDHAFEEIEGEDYSVEVPLIEKNEIKQLEFRIKPRSQTQYVSEPVKVAVSSDNQSEIVSNFDYVLMPSVNGALPELTVDAVSPNSVYYTGYREFSITGKGFDMLNDKRLWKLFLVDDLGGELEIPGENVTIASDEQLGIILYEDTFGTETGPGEYTFKLDHADLGVVRTPASKAVTFSTDPKYKSRSYGVLYIEKVESGDEYTYEIGLADSVEHLGELKESKDIVYDIVGDIVETTDENDNAIYKVKTDRQDAIINSVITYKDASEPIEIKKTDDLITIVGDGTLQIVGSNEFWWWKFYTYIADGEDYTIEDVVVEEEEEEEGNVDIDPEGSDEEEEEQSNIVIDFFNPINAIGAAVNTFYDGFNVEIKNVVLLDEGASFGGSLSVEVPFGAEVPEEKEEEEISDEENEELMWGAFQDLFLEEEERQQKYDARKKEDARKPLSIKLRALLLSDDGILPKIVELQESSATPAEKGRVILDMVLASPELLATVYAAIKGKPEEEDPDRKSVGVTIDVKKVIFGKKYKEDFLYDSVQYIGLDASGEIKVALPFGTEEEREEDNQGVRAYASINTIEEEYTFEADVDLKMAEAHAIVSIVKVDNELKPDHIELSGGYKPGVPVAPPVFIHKLGGGVKNLQGKDPNEPVSIILILGLNLEPTFEGDFRAEMSLEGFSLNGSFEIKGGFEVFKEAYVEVQWVRPVYLALGATVELFDIIEGSASVYIGEVPAAGGGYKFYFEGKVNVSISIPKKVWFVGGMEAGSAELGVSTEKMWGHVEVIGIGVGITYVYGEGVSFADGGEELRLENLTNVGVPEHAIYEGKIAGADGSQSDGTFIVGSNIRKVGDSENVYVSGGMTDVAVVANAGGTSYDFAVNGQDHSLFEIGFEGAEPKLTLTDPNGVPIPLVPNENYMVRVVAAEDAPSGVEEKYVYISVVNPTNGTYTVTSDKALEVGTMYEAKAIPKIDSVDFERVGDTLDVAFEASHPNDAVVSLFLVNAAVPDDAGIALASNLAADDGDVAVDLPANLPDGTYALRASIQHPSYGFHDLTTAKTLTIVDPHKPADLEGLKVESIGDGLLKAAWTKPSETGDMTFYANVYDAAGNKVAGFQNLSTGDNKLLFGSGYTGVNERGEEIEYSMPYGATYTIGVTPVKTIRNGDGTESVHVGNEARSAPFQKRVPTPPQLTLGFTEPGKVVDGISYFNKEAVNLDFHSIDKQSREPVVVDTDIYLDGEYYVTMNRKSEISLPLEAADGNHTVEFRAANEFGDRAKIALDFVVDTSPPELLIDSPATSVVAADAVDVAGTAESGASVYLNGEKLTVNGDGTFRTRHAIDPEKMKETIAIKAVDAAGNETVYQSEIVNGAMKPVERIALKSTSRTVYTGVKEQLVVVALYPDEGKEIEIDSGDVEFSVLKGGNLGSVGDDGELTLYDTGNITVLASYALTDDYVLSDAVELSIESAMEKLIITPEISRMTVGQSVNLYAQGQYEHGEKAIDNGQVQYSLVQGQDKATLEGNVLTAVAKGAITVKAVYHDGGSAKEALRNIDIVERGTGTPPPPPAASFPPAQQSDPDFVEAKVIATLNAVLTGIWENLIEREKNLEITSAREIRKDLNTRITLLKVGSLDIPVGTVDEDDVFLTGFLNNPDEIVNEDEYARNGEVYELTFKDALGKLNQNITLRLAFDPSKVEDEQNLGIYVYNEIFGKWQYVGGEIQGTELVVSLAHLSRYAVLEDVKDPGFMDIDGLWAEQPIRALESLGVANGIVSGGYRYFAPSRNLSRLELAALAVRVYEQMHPGQAATPAEAENRFADYDRIADWGKASALKAYQYGMIEGTLGSDGRYYFQPEGEATRAETMTILSRAMGISSDRELSFEDNRDIPAWAGAHIAALLDLGLARGYEDDTIRPNQRITRAEMASLLYNWVEHEVMAGK